MSQQRQIFDGTDWQPLGEPVEVPMIEWPTGACTVLSRDGVLTEYAAGELIMSMPTWVVGEPLRSLPGPSGEAGERSDDPND